MLRSRVRRSFTVEVKSKSRQTTSWPEDPAPSPVNWAALDPAPKTPSSFEAVWPDASVSAAPAAVAEKPRRILPSLIVAEPEPEAPEPVAEREPRLPRVRRVKPPQARAEAPRSDATWSFSDIAEAADEHPAPVPAISRQVPVVAAVSMPARKPLRARAAKPALAPGERWKRRLPRSCR